ncbi:hypothetical protein DPMN_168012 [Dreissena polymorpha]|uniref:Uncharacterized protein n=1 Tax=Dreissena polymorpha TaxID=45954 RepID=A0A9D4F2H9_DREPO|nr:hypothetical protein DPMN_168012 [Dreissena polymorpha]
MLDNCVKRNSHAKLSRGSGENLESDVDYVFTVFEGKRGLMHVNLFLAVIFLTCRTSKTLDSIRCNISQIVVRD